LVLKIQQSGVGHISLLTQQKGTMFCDGTFNKGPHFRHILLFAVTIDGNNKVLLLAYAVVSSENENNWSWFVGKLCIDFPGITVIQSDADKGIRSNICQEVLEGNDIIPGRCVFHMLQNCPGAKGSKLVRRLVLELAKSSTHEGYLLKLEELSRRGLTDVATWFNARRKQYATYCKFSSSYNCFKSINSNPHLLHF
jgi:MULE transposase domain